MTPTDDLPGPGAGQLTEQRKHDHLDLFRSGGVEARKGSTWFEHVLLIHQATPEIGWDDIDLTAHFAGHVLKAPLFIAAMTGGTDEASEINHALAGVAQELGIGFGVGSQRAMLENPAQVVSYRVREVAPDVFLAGNIGAVQLRALSGAQVRGLVDDIGADALCVHLNPAHELMQPEGDRNFSGIVQRLKDLVEELPVPVIVKETGCGISRETGLALKGAGVHAVDVAGSGGTSWVGVEVLRSQVPAADSDHPFWDWGIPTAAALLDLQGQGLELMASGGIRDGLDVARAMALGADIAGLASPVLQAYFNGGLTGVRRLLDRLLTELRTACLLTGSRTPGALKEAPCVLTGELRSWQLQRGISNSERGAG